MNEIDQLKQENERLKRELLRAMEVAGILINVTNKFQANIELGGVNNIFLTYPDEPGAYYLFPYGVQWIVQHHNRAHDLYEAIDFEYVQGIYDEYKGKVSS